MAQSKKVPQKMEAICATIDFEATAEFVEAELAKYLAAEKIASCVATAFLGG